MNALLSSRAENVVILPSLKSASLISLGQLCDDDCKVLLDKRKLYAVKKNTLVLQGDRNKDDGLWDIKIPYYEVYKKNLQTDNYHQPTTHAARYDWRRRRDTGTDARGSRGAAVGARSTFARSPSCAHPGGASGGHVPAEVGRRAGLGAAVRRHSRARAHRVRHRPGGRDLRVVGGASVRRVLHPRHLHQLCVAHNTAHSVSTRSALPSPALCARQCQCA